MTATIAIGPLTPAHRPRIEEIVRATGVFAQAEVDVALELFDNTFGEMGHRRLDIGLSPLSDLPSPVLDYEFVGAFEGETLVGYACFGPTPATDRTYDLYWIAVHPDAQRAGTGAALMDHVERTLEERRARMLVIETSSRDTYAPTRKFYHKRGYQEAAQLQDFYAAGDDRIVLTRRVFAGPDGKGADRLPQ